MSWQRGSCNSDKKKILPWSTQLVGKLIDFYHDNHLLWDPNDNEYRVKARRDQSLTSFLADNGLKNKLFTVEDVKFKWKLLRTTFMENYKKAKRPGLNNKDRFVPTWQYYERMSFLKAALECGQYIPKRIRPPRNRIRDKLTGLYFQDLPVDSGNDDDNEEILVDIPNDDDDKAQLNRLMNVFDSNTDNSLADAVPNQHESTVHNYVKEEMFQTGEDEKLKLEDHFGSCIAMHLQEMDPRSRDLAQCEIMQVVMKYKYGSNSS